MLRRFVRALADRAGFRIVSKNSPHFSEVPRNVEAGFLEIYHKCRPYTMTGANAMYALYKAVEYIVRFEVPGDLAECGVFKGGSIMLCAEALKAFGDTSRRLYLYDTFEGMSKPTDRDVDFRGRTPEQHLATWGAGKVSDMARVDLEQVRANLALTGYPPDRVVFVKGKVEETIPGTVPEQLALLRLDTDWYESTKHEMVHLYPRLARYGVLIVDDYGFWRGAREAVDEYLTNIKAKMLLSRVDVNGEVLGVKLD